MYQCLGRSIFIKKVILRISYVAIRYRTTTMKLSCKDLDPKLDCDFVASGKTEDEVAQRMMDHLKKSHPDKIKELRMSDEKMISWLQSKVHE